MFCMGGYKTKRSSCSQGLSLRRNKLYWLRSKYNGSGPENNVFLMLIISLRAMDAKRNIVTGLISIHIIDRYK